MKNVLKSLALVAVSALAVVSCQKNELASQNDGEGVFFSLRTGDAGKTYIVVDGKNYKPQWAKGDEIGVFFDEFTSGKKTPAGMLENTNESGATAKFEGEIASAPEAGTLYAFYPASALGNTYDGQSIGFDMPSVQRPTATSFDPAADILVSQPLTFTTEGGAVKVSVAFARILATLKVNLNSDFTGVKDKKVSSFKLEAAEATLSGRAAVSMTAADGKITTWNIKSKTISATYDETSIVAVAGDANSVFVTINPETIKTGETIKFTIETEDYIITKGITLANDIVLTPGKLTEINLSLTKDDCEEKEDVDYSGEYLIVSGKYLLTDYNTSEYYNRVEAAETELSDFWEIPNIEDYVWTVAKLTDGSYSFCNAGSGKYLALTAASNKAHESEEINENTAMTITKEGDASLTIYSKAFSGRHLRYNTSSPRFAFYGSGSTTGTIATLLTYTSDPRTPFDVVSGLAWDASSKTLSWTAVEGATNGYEYTTDNGTSVVAVESNSVDCSNWTNGDYSVKVRVVGTDAKKTSEWSEACEFTITGGATASTLSFDFVTHPTGWPATKDKAAEGSYSYTLDNETYTFTHSKSGDGIYCGGTSGSSGYLMVAKSNTLGLPAISGYKLTKVVGTLNGSGSPSTKSEVSITDGTNVITGGTSQTWNQKGSSYTYNLAGTEENTVYYLSVSSAANCQVIKIELTYEKTNSITSLVVSGTPTKTSYKAGDDFDTSGLIATATYDDASTEDVTDEVEWTVIPTPLTVGTPSVSVVATYKGVYSDAKEITGITVTEPAALESITVKTAPTKVTYKEGETFEPAGLVISRNYSDKTTDEYAYANHEDEFEFSPALDAALATTDNKVTITYKEKSVDQEITVNDTSLKTMDEIFAAATAAGKTATDTKVKFDNWVVSGVKNSNVYLTDNNGKGLIIYTSNHGFEVGDILSGTVNSKVQLYNGAAELTSLASTTEGLTVTKGGVVTPATIAIADLSGVNTGAVITFASLKYDGSVFSDGKNTITPYGTFMTLPALISGRNYSVTGVYIQFNQTKEIAPRTADDFKLLSGPYLDASASKTSVAAAGETVTITVDTNIEDWTVKSDNAAFVVGTKSGNAVPVTVSENTSTTDERTAKITVSATGVDDVVITLTQSKAGQGAEMTVTLTMSDYFSAAEEIASEEGKNYVFGDFTFTFVKKNSSTSNYNASDKGIRFYQNDIMTINAGSKSMTKIEFEWNGRTGPFTTDVGSFTGNSWTGSASVVKLTASAQARFKSITITYTN